MTSDYKILILLNKFIIAFSFDFVLINQAIRSFFDGGVFLSFPYP